VRNGCGLPYAFEVFLEVQYRLQALCSTVADGVALRWGTEGPRTLAPMSVILSIVHGVAFYLRLIQSLQPSRNLPDLALQ
jgi:hypothetical protein